MAPPDDSCSGQGAGANSSSSDFVRKLYKMLEDPSYSDVVRWTMAGESFVVLENEKFTKTILPKHFKHSNFASFVRQLNKYDFHKVRQNEETGESPYGRDAWEFKHPEFQKDAKDNLDNIRRKAPAPRKAQQAEETFPSNQQFNVIGETLQATQHQIQSLQETCAHLSYANKVLVAEVLHLRNLARMQKDVTYEVLAHLNNIDDRRRNSRQLGQMSFHNGTLGSLPDSGDEPAAELRRAKEVLSAASPDSHVDRDFEKLTSLYQSTVSPPDSATSSIIFTQPPMPMPFMTEPLADTRHMVYPVGNNTGINPLHSDHIHNIPYSRPVSNPSTLLEVPSTLSASRDRNESIWAGRKPRVLLVEDDKTCAKIGSKFLQYADCEQIEVATNGLDAVNKINKDGKWDLIFMDIIMPHLDGLSATSLIRMVIPQCPIIAMTANIRREDINMYIQFGMNDVLAKPFTKDGMVQKVKRHLNMMLKHPVPLDSLDEIYAHVPAVGAAPAGLSHAYGAQIAMCSADMAGGQAMPGNRPVQVKYEPTPAQSPSMTAWHSPNATTRTDATVYMAQTGMSLSPQTLAYATTTNHRRGMTDDFDRRAEKRPRVSYGPSVGPYG